MKIELDRNDIVVVKNLLEEVYTQQKIKIKDMQKDKHCTFENYNQHLDEIRSLGIILSELEKQL